MKRIAVEGMTLDKLHVVTKGDPVLQQVIPLVNGHWPAKAQVPPNLLAYHNVHGDLHVENGCLAHDAQFVVPISLRMQILQQAHLGHPGVTRMKRLLHESYWWPLMSLQVEELVAHCSGCQFSEKSSPPADIPKVVVPCPEVCWTKIGVDIAGPFADSTQNQHYIVTAIDYTSNYPECLLMLDIRSSKLIDWLEYLFACYGNPNQLVSDNGLQFVSTEFSNFLKSHGIEHVHTAVYNPSENGLVEVFNNVLKYGVQCFQSATFQALHGSLHSGSRWKGGIQELLKAYRATLAKSGKKCPAELFFRRPFHLDFQIPKRQPKLLAAHRILLCGPFVMEYLVLTKRPHMPKGQSPYAGPFRIIDTWTLHVSSQ